MTEERTLKGFWWIPANPERRWFGVLTQTDKVIELVCYSEDGDVGLVPDSPSGTVHGSDEKGRPVTLLLASRETSNGTRGLKEVRVRSAYVLAGIHVTGKDLIRAQRVSLHVQHLYGWLSMTGFLRAAPGSVIRADGTGEFAINYRASKPALHRVAQGRMIAFGLNFELSMHGRSQQISEDSYFEIAQEGGLTFDDARKVATDL